MDQNTREKGAASTTIGHTIVIRGKLKSDEDLIVHGRIDAEITSAKAVLIEQAGIVKAGIRAESVSVSGILIGNAQADARMEISSGGRMIGDILSPKIVISDGAAFRGQIDMPTFEQSRVIDDADESLLTSPNGRGLLKSSPPLAASNGSTHTSSRPIKPPPSVRPLEVTGAAPAVTQSTPDFSPVPPLSADASTATTAAAQTPAAPDTAARPFSAALSSFGSGDPLNRPSTTNKQAEGAEADDDDAYSMLNLGRKGKKKKGLF
jgi:cytoskeletal protein CcmA (bactofilin family)